MSSKLLGSLSAHVVHDRNGDSRVEVRALKTTPAFSDKAEDAFSLIRVFRLEADDFQFGNDYQEYFDGLRYSEARVVLEGPIEPENNRAFTFLDSDVETGKTYCYWMGGATGEPTGPTAVKIRDPEVWWPYETVVARANALAARYPGRVRVESIGRTVRGQRMIAVRAGNGGRSVALVGAVHAGEAGAELALGALSIILEEDPELLDDVSLSIIPTVNIDEREREVAGTPWYLRTNATGVDLNRNFPADWDTVELGYGLDSSRPGSMTYRGPFAGSEPETQAVMEFLKSTRPAAVFASHCLAGICGIGLITARDAEADAEYAERCRSLARAYVDGSGIPLPEGKGLGFVCTAGSLAAWCWRVLGVPAFDLEISAAAEPQAYEACRRDATDRALIERYQRVHAGSLRSALSKLRSEPEA